MYLITNKNPVELLAKKQDRKLKNVGPDMS